MKRLRKNKDGRAFYMVMSILCLTALFLGYSFVYRLAAVSYTHLADNGRLPNCVLFYGNEEYFMDYSVKYIKYKFIDKSYEDMNYAEFEKLDSLKDYFEFVNTFPFMSDKKLCLIKEAVFLTSAGSLDKKDEEKLLEYIEENEDCITVFLIKGGKPDSRKKVVKKLKDKKAVFEFTRLNEKELTKYIMDEFKKNKFNILPADANYMATNTGYLEYESIVSLYHVCLLYTSLIIISPPE